MNMQHPNQDNSHPNIAVSSNEVEVQISTMAQPFHIQMLEKHLDLNPFIDQLEEMFFKPIASSSNSRGTLSESDLDFSTRGIWGEELQRKKDLSELYNFDKVGKRKWLKNILLENSDSDTDEQITDTDIKILLKIHKYRRKYQKRYHTDIMNSQCTYYAAGLLSEYDLHPQHQSYITEQYGYIPTPPLLSKSSNENSNASTKPKAEFVVSQKPTTAPGTVIPQIKQQGIVTTSKKRKFTPPDRSSIVQIEPMSIVRKMSSNLDQQNIMMKQGATGFMSGGPFVGMSSAKPISIRPTLAPPPPVLQIGPPSCNVAKKPKVKSLSTSTAPVPPTGASMTSQMLQQQSSMMDHQSALAPRITTTVSTGATNNNKEAWSFTIANRSPVVSKSLQPRQPAMQFHQSPGLTTPTSFKNHDWSINNTPNNNSSALCSSSKSTPVQLTPSVQPAYLTQTLAHLDPNFKATWKSIVNDVLTKACNEKYIMKTYRAVVLKNIAASCQQFLSQSSKTAQSPVKMKSKQKKKNELTSLRPVPGGISSFLNNSNNKPSCL